ncbi:hypothetical protein AAC387_Pa05g2538 [Persea americana]
MKSSISLVPFIILFLLVKAQGIRLESRCITTHHEIREERSSIEGSAVGEFVICKDGHCSGRSRKLMTPAKATSESARNKGVEVEVTAKKNSRTVGSNGKNFDVESPKLEHQVSTAESYPDDIDIAGMDYSPAKRKPPIHN